MSLEEELRPRNPTTLIFEDPFEALAADTFETLTDFLTDFPFDWLLAFPHFPAEVFFADAARTETAFDFPAEVFFVDAARTETALPRPPEDFVGLSLPLLPLEDFVEVSLPLLFFTLEVFANLVLIPFC